MGLTLKITFRRCVDNRLLLLWYDMLSIVQSIVLSNEDDVLIWKLESNGVYSVRSMYAMINFRGISQVHIPDMWKIHVPPNIHIFLWLLAHNKLLVRENLVKRQHFNDLSCLFCSEGENINHLFFECVVAKYIWGLVSEHFGTSLGADYLSISRF